MLFIALVVALLILSLLYLILPLFTRAKLPSSSRAIELDRAISKIDQDVALNRLGAEEAAETRVRLERQLVVEIDREEAQNQAYQDADKPGFNSQTVGWSAVFAIALVGAGTFYWLSFGSPGLPGQPLVSREDLDLPVTTSDEARGVFQAAILESRRSGDDALVQQLRAQLNRPTAPSQTQSPAAPSAEAQAEMAQLSSEEQRTRISGMVAGLAERLADDPDDLEGWQRLAQSYRVLGQTKDERTALREIIRLDPEGPVARERLARSLMTDVPPGGEIPQAAAEQFRALFDANPTNVQAAFFSGLHAFQSGNQAAASKYLNAALAAVPEDSPARASIEAEINRLIGE